MKHRRKELIEVVVAAHGAGNANPSADDREDGQNHQRQQHDFGTFMNAAVAVAVSSRSRRRRIVMGRFIPPEVRSMSCMLGMAVDFFRRAAVLAEERHEPQAEHVEGGQECGEDADQPSRPS